MYLVGITEEDFVGSEVQMKSDKKHVLAYVKGEIANVKTPYASGTLNNIYMFEGTSMGEEKAVAIA